MEGANKRSACLEGKLKPRFRVRGCGSRFGKNEYKRWSIAKKGSCPCCEGKPKCDIVTEDDGSRYNVVICSKCGRMLYCDYCGVGIDE